MTHKRSLTLLGTSYNVAEFTDIQLLSLMKYADALNPEKEFALTEEIDKAASYALRKIIPGIPRSIATPDGINGITISEFTELFVQLIGLASRLSPSVADALAMPDQSEQDLLNPDYVQASIDPNGQPPLNTAIIDPADIDPNKQPTLTPIIDPNDPESLRRRLAEIENPVASA